jgi:DNA-binding transcriptional LysR family regulator
MNANGLTRLELRHLTALALVAEHASFSRAAEELGYTQSAVSQQIAALERALGERLVERPGGPVPVRLTDAGVLVARHAEAITDRLRALRVDLEAFASGAATRLRIGSYPSVAAHVIPRILRSFLDAWPAVQVELTESGDDEAVLREIARGELDLGFVTLPAGPGPLTEIGLLDDPYLFVPAADSPLADRSVPLPLRALADLALIGYPPSSCQRRLEGALRSAGVEPRIVFRSSDNATVQALVRAGVGHAVVPELTIDARDEGVVVRSLEPAMPPRRVGLVVHADRYQSPALRAFIEATLEHCGQAAAAVPA